MFSTCFVTKSVKTSPFDVRPPCPFPPPSCACCAWGSCCAPSAWSGSRGPGEDFSTGRWVKDDVTVTHHFGPFFCMLKLWKIEWCRLRVIFKSCIMLPTRGDLSSCHHQKKNLGLWSFDEASSRVARLIGTGNKNRKTPQHSDFEFQYLEKPFNLNVEDAI